MGLMVTMLCVEVVPLLKMILSLIKGGRGTDGKRKVRTELRLLHG